MTDTLRFTTAGSVDDGKSTLIGRLLLDSKSLLEDQLASVKRTTERRGDERLDLSLFTDGLIAEREQGITIDVAYRYFATPRRRFIVADTPGHEQYTRNMVTGASNADLSVILVDATKGIVEQTRRHAAVAALLRVPHVVLAINKMDAVQWSRTLFERIAADFTLVAHAFDLRRVTAIPMSALEGDMVVDRGERLDWHEGPTLLDFLEAVRTDRRSHALRFPVQLVSRSRFGKRSEFRGLLGRVEAGRIAVGDDVRVWPSRTDARIAEIWTYSGPLDAASAGHSITVVLDRQVDVARGDVLSHRDHAPRLGREVTARLAWLDHEALNPGARYALKHTTQTVRATVDAIESRLDLALLEPYFNPEKLGFNDLGDVRLRLSRPLVADRYDANRSTGSFVLIDEVTNRTVAGGVILGLRE